MNERVKQFKPMTNTVIVAFLIVFLFFCVYAVIYQRVQESLRITSVQQVQTSIEQSTMETNAIAQGILSQLSKLHTKSVHSLMPSRCKITAQIMVSLSFLHL